MTREQMLAWANEVERMGALGNIARVNEITRALGGVTVPPGWYPNEFYAIAAGIRAKVAQEDKR
jgi:hypothetical protein